MTLLFLSNASIISDIVPVSVNGFLFLLLTNVIVYVMLPVRGLSFIITFVGRAYISLFLGNSICFCTTVFCPLSGSVDSLLLNLITNFITHFRVLWATYNTGGLEDITAYM